jgi:S1-C subfamily serine protease
MQSLSKPPSLSHWPARFLCLLGIVGCIYLYPALVPQASAGIPGGNVSDPVVRQVDIARPAVVRIITRIDGRLTVRFTAASSAVTFPQDGSSYPVELSGSGAFVSARGDILTADHVVNPPHDQALDEALYQIAAQDIADYVNSHFQVSQPLSASDVVAALETGMFGASTDYGQTVSRAYLSTAFTGPVNAARFPEIPSSNYATVDQIEAQSSFDAMDVAIVHVSGMDDMPAIQLGDSSQVAEQDTLTIIGYPGLGDVSNAPTNLLTSSINRVYVSAMKTTDSGAPVIQVGGNVEHGDSGGPALDGDGHIVGIVSFGLIDPGASGETSFLQASNSARALIQGQGINTAPGPFQRAWVQAFADYASTTVGHWHRAVRELQGLADRYKGFLGITPYLTYAQSQAGSEQLTPVSAPTGGSTILVVILALLALMVMAGLLLLVLRQRTLRPGPAVAAYPSWWGSSYTPQQNGASGGFLPRPESYSLAPQAPGWGGNPAVSQVEQAVASVPLTPQPAVDTPSPLLSENGATPFLPPIDTPWPAEGGWWQAPEAERQFSAGTPSQHWPASVLPSASESIVPGEDLAPVGEDSSALPPVLPSAEQPPAQGSASAFADGPADGASRVDRLEGQERMALCGHASLGNEHFCRVCGQPVTLVDGPQSAERDI